MIDIPTFQKLAEQTGVDQIVFDKENKRLYLKFCPPIDGTQLRPRAFFKSSSSVDEDLGEFSIERLGQIKSDALKVARKESAVIAEIATLRILTKDTDGSEKLGPRLTNLLAFVNEARDLALDSGHVDWSQRRREVNRLDAMRTALRFVTASQLIINANIIYVGQITREVMVSFKVAHSKAENPGKPLMKSERSLRAYFSDIRAATNLYIHHRFLNETDPDEIARIHAWKCRVDSGPNVTWHIDGKIPITPKKSSQLKNQPTPICLPFDPKTLSFEKSQLFELLTVMRNLRVEPHLYNDWAEPAVLMLSLTGARWVELIKLTYGDIEGRHIRIENSKKKTDGPVEYRKLLITKPLKSVLNQIKRSTEYRTGEQINPSTDRDTPIFPELAPGGAKVSPTHSKQLKKKLNSIGFDYTSRTFRHLFATLHVLSGTQTDDIVKSLGHASDGMLKTVYSDIKDTVIDRKATGLFDWVAGLIDQPNWVETADSNMLAEDIWE